MQFIYKSSIHDDAASELFGAGDIVHASGAPSPCLLIGFVNRSGSNYFAELLRWRAIPNLLAPRMVIVSRQDVVSQAVSLYIASHTKQWRSVDTAVAHDEIKYDGKRIMNTIRSITRAYAMLKQVAVLAQIPHQESTTKTCSQHRKKSSPRSPKPSPAGHCNHAWTRSPSPCSATR